jgi:hypothetical protein
MLDIDDDVLAAAIELACGQKTTAGKVISGLARSALSGPILSGPAVQLELHGAEPPKYRVSFRLMSRTGAVIAPDKAGKLQEDGAWPGKHLDK